MPSRVTQEERTCSYGRSGTTKIAGGRRPGCLAEYTATKGSTPIAEQCVTVAPATQEGRPDQLQTQAEGEFMGNLEGLVRMVKELTVETTNLVNGSMSLSMWMRLWRFWASWIVGVATPNRGVHCRRRLAKRSASRKKRGGKRLERDRSRQRGTESDGLGTREAHHFGGSPQ
jgi:hypothetical protein